MVTGVSGGSVTDLDDSILRTQVPSPYLSKSIDVKKFGAQVAACLDTPWGPACPT
jgi:hypothetical protein